MKDYAQEVKGITDRVVADMELSVTALKNYAPRETHELLDVMLQQFKTLATLSVVLAETPFDLPARRVDRTWN